MFVTVRRVTGKAHCVEMRPDDTVGALKERLHEALGIPPSQQVRPLQLF